MAANESLNDQVADGSILPDSIDPLTQAADPTTGVIPTDLLAAASGLSPEETSLLVRDHLQQSTSRDTANGRHEAQHQARRVRRDTVPSFGGDPELARLAFEGPDAVIQQIWDVLHHHADRAYQEQGGRDTLAGDHIPWVHRMFDAGVSLLTGAGADSAGRAGSGSRVRPVTVITLSVADLVGEGAANQVGVGPIGDDVLARAVEQGGLAAAVLGMDGQPLWLGRTSRHASVHQFLALAVRDRGCVLCGASIVRCHTHHLTPWNAPAKGPTNIDNLALVCGGCHHDLHQRNHTLYQAQTEGRRRWRTRPATPQETPPKRPPKLKRRTPPRRE